MELDQKVRYALVAFTLASVILAGIGLHTGHLGFHLRALEGGGNAD